LQVELFQPFARPQERHVLVAEAAAAVPEANGDDGVPRQLRVSGNVPAETLELFHNLGFVGALGGNPATECD
jgi:hypothetical protein